MPGPIYTAGRTPLTSNISSASGLIQSPPLLGFPKKQSEQIIKSKNSIKTPPTIVTTADLAEGLDTRLFDPVTTQAGDWIVFEVVGEDGNLATVTPSVSGVNFAMYTNGGTAGSKVRVQQWAGIDLAGGSRTITATPSDISRNYVARVTVIRGSDGPSGKIASATGQTISFARQNPNSAVFMIIGDWTAGAVGSPVWTPGGSTVVSQQGSAATYIFGRWDDSGSVVAAVSHGISSPSYTTPSIAVLEMQGSTVAAAPVITGSATLTSDSTLTVSGSNYVLADSSLISNSNQTTAAILGVLGASSLSAQSVQAASSVVTSFGQSLFTIASDLIASGTIAKIGSANLTIESNLVAIAVTAGNVSAALSGQSVLTVSGSVSVLTSSDLTIQSGLNASSLVTKLASSSLSGQSNLAVAAIDTVLSGVIPFNSQSSLTASGTVGALPVIITLSAESGLTAIGSKITLASAVLAADTTVTASSIVSQLSAAALSATATLTVSGTIGKFALAALSGQSTLTVSGFIPVIYFGTATFIIQSVLQADGIAAPPWILTLIEFSSVRAVSYDLTTGRNSTHNEGSSKVTSIEGS